MPDPVKKSPSMLTGIPGVMLPGQETIKLQHVTAPSALASSSTTTDLSL
jgi:hypothetical protein